MATQLRPALVVFLLLTLITGVAYPLTVTGIVQAIFPYQANGSLIVKSGRVVGSELIGQSFSSLRYLHPRPLAAGAQGYDPLASGGSNLGPTNSQLASALADRAAQFRNENGLDATTPLPADIVTSSASGLDPDISPEAAYLQVHRIALARGLTDQAVRIVVQSNITPPFLGIFGEPTVNVLRVNLALDALP